MTIVHTPVVRKRPRYLSRTIWRMLIHGSLVGLSIVFFLPLFLVISASFSDEQLVITHGYQLIPEKFSTYAYDFVFKDPGQLIRSYSVTVIVSVTGTLLSVFITALMAYALSRSRIQAPSCDIPSGLFHHAV